MAKGNPNPSPATRFQPGNVANPGGMSAAVRARNDRTADLASQIREKLISATMEKLDSGVDLFELLTPEVIRIVKDSEDRAHGTPRQSVEHTGSVDHKHSARNMTDDELAAYLHDDPDQS